MPLGYEKPEHKTNAEKAKEAEKKAPPRERPTDSDHTKVKQPKEKPS